MILLAADLEAASASSSDSDALDDSFELRVGEYLSVGLLALFKGIFSVSSAADCSLNSTFLELKNSSAFSKVSVRKDK